MLLHRPTYHLRYKTWQTIILDKHLIIAAGLLPLAHNAQHSTSCEATEHKLAPFPGRKTRPGTHCSLMRTIITQSPRTQPLPQSGREGPGYGHVTSFLCSESCSAGHQVEVPAGVFAAYVSAQSRLFCVINVHMCTS